NSGVGLLSMNDQANEHAPGGKTASHPKRAANLRWTAPQPPPKFEFPRQQANSGVGLLSMNDQANEHAPGGKTASHPKRAANLR
ncbi:hypothetical protein CQA04_27435, partial [Escherichia coli]